MVAGTVDLSAVRKQVEYYFSDSNLPRDKFLRAKTEENEAGFVDIAVLLTFNRLSALGATLENIADAITTSEVVLLDETRTRLRRTHPLPETPEWRNRAIYAKGWNATGPEPSIEAVNELFSPSGEILSVRIRRWKDDDGRHFKGSIFVEFSTAEAAERAAAEEYAIETTDVNGKSISRNLIILPVDTYFDKKRQEAKERRARKSAQNGRKKKIDTNGNTADNGKAVSPFNGDTPHDNAKNEPATAKVEPTKVKEEPKKRELIPGMVLRFEGFGPDVSREDIKEAFEKHGDIAWVDFRRGDADGHIRFSRAGAAEEACKAETEQKSTFGNKVPKFFVLSGEAEEAYWKETWEKQDLVMERSKKRRRDNNRGFGNKRRRGGGGGGFGRGRGRGRGRDRF